MSPDAQDPNKIDAVSDESVFAQVDKILDWLKKEHADAMLAQWKKWFGDAPIYGLYGPGEVRDWDDTDGRWFG